MAIQNLLEYLSDSNREPRRLSEIECHRFHEDGFIHIDSVFSKDEVDAIRSVCGEIVSDNAAPTEHLEDGFRSWRAVTTVSPELAGLACDPRLIGAAIQLLGTSLRLVGSQLIHRAPHLGPRKVRTPERPGWHRDIYGMAKDLGLLAPPCAIKCAIWLTEGLSLEHGITRFLAGSHERGLPLIPPGEIDPPGWFSPIVRPGDMTIFENRTAHTGGLNTSNHTLEILMMQYGYRWLAPVTGRQHDPTLIHNSSKLARQILEPEDCDADGEYRPGSGAAVIAEWAATWNLKRHRLPPDSMEKADG